MIIVKYVLALKMPTASCLDTQSQAEQEVDLIICRSAV